MFRNNDFGKPQIMYNAIKYDVYSSSGSSVYANKWTQEGDVVSYVCTDNSRSIT